MSQASNYNSIDGTSKTLIGNYVEERALAEQSGYTRGVYDHQKLHTKPRILGQNNNDSNQDVDSIKKHFTTTTHASYISQQTNNNNTQQKRSALREQQYSNVVQHMLQQNELQRTQQQYELAKQWQYGHRDPNYDLSAKNKLNKNITDHITHTNPYNDENVKTLNQTGTTYYTDKLNVDKFNKSTDFSKPISEYHGSTTKML